MKKPIYYVDGKYVTEDLAKISVLDLGLMRGYAVNEYLRTYQGQPFHLQDHLNRLISTLDQVMLTCPVSISELESIIYSLLEKNNFTESSIKIIVTGGLSSNQLFPDNSPNLYVLVNPLTPYPKSCFTEGIKVVTKPFMRPFPAAKTLQYLPAIVALKEARQKDAFDAIFLGRENQLLETGTANFFALKGNCLITCEQDVLPGITRQVILYLAKEHFEIEIRPIYYEEISSFDGAFLTASNKQVMPVVQIDSFKIGHGNIPKNIQFLMQLFREYIQSYSSSLIS